MVKIARGQTVGIKAVVVGSSGFLGKALSLRLHSLGFDVTGISRSRSQDLLDAGINLVALDIAEGERELKQILSGADVVFHTAAKVSMWGDPHEFERINVFGTSVLLSAARDAGVSYFIYTSSPSVIASGRDLKGVNESQPFPGHYEAEYPRTKALAEKIVLSSHSESFRTLALRPHLIFGKGDTNLIPKILQRSAEGKLVRIGNGTNLSDFCWIDDCVSAHIKGYEALKVDSKVGGKAYFISQGDPVGLWWFVDRVLELNGLPKVKRAVPLWLAKVLACIAEKVALLRKDWKEPFLTRFLVSEMATHHYFDITAARKSLGFSPSCSVAEALNRTFLSE